MNSLDVESICKKTLIVIIMLFVKFYNNKYSRDLLI